MKLIGCHNSDLKLIAFLMKLVSPLQPGPVRAKSSNPSIVVSENVLMFMLSMSEHLGTICIALLDCVVVVDAFVVVVEAVGTTSGPGPVWS